MTTNIDTSNGKNQEILTEWKKLYTEALIDALKPSGDVLQVGYGNGIAANRIQTFKPKSHVIVESNPGIIPRLKDWAKKNPNVTIVEEKWEKAAPKLKAFDVIYFNEESESDAEILNSLFPEEMEKASSQAKQIYNEIKDQVAHVTVSFSEKDIEDFYQKIGQYKSNELSEFFRLMKENGNISEELYKKAIKKYKMDESKKSKKKQNTTEEKPKDSMLLFLEECIRNHMHKGSKFSCFLKNQVSKYPDSAFFESIITNPDLDYREDSITLKMSDKPRKALVMVVEKQS